jgi:dephospho-CoA kinase
MKVVGVTGTIGSGKTLFCKFLSEMGARVVHADSLAKDLMVSDFNLQKSIKNKFGPDAYHTDGSLNRTYLAQQAFTHGMSDELNQIVHPAVHKRIHQIIDDSRRDGVQLFVYEAALLLQKGRENFLDHVIWIQADLQIRIDRVVNRDNLAINEILSRNERQKQLPEVASMIDEIIINDGSVKELQIKASNVFSRLTQQ